MDGSQLSIENEKKRKALLLKYDIDSARYNYSISYERAKISKWRDRFSFIFPFAVMAVFIVLSVFYKDYFLQHLPYFTEDKFSIWYPAALFIITSVLAVPIARIVFPEILA